MDKKKVCIHMEINLCSHILNLSKEFNLYQESMKHLKYKKEWLHSRSMQNQKYNVKHSWYN